MRRIFGLSVRTDLTVDLLLKEIQVVGTPGEGFGSSGEGYFRFSTFGSREDANAAAAKLRQFFKNLKNGNK